MTGTKQKQADDWDTLLHIKTTGRDDSISNQVNYPYEPTDYSVLERLANEGCKKIYEQIFE